MKIARATQTLHQEFVKAKGRKLYNHANARRDPAREEAGYDCLGRKMGSTEASIAFSKIELVSHRNKIVGTVS